jgi:hypothetical protein
MRSADIDQGRRTISGQVSAAAVPIQGRGFSAVKAGVGNYTITFDDMTPVSCTAVPTVGAGYIANALSYTARTVSVATITAANSALIDQPFSFIATGIKR